MAYTVFLSYGGKDNDLVSAINESLSRFSNIEVYIAEWIQMAGVPLEVKVRNGLDRSFAMIALITNNSINSEWMQQEIGYATAKNRNIIPIVEQGVNIKGFLEAKEYIPLERYNLDFCIYLIIHRLNTLIGSNQYFCNLGNLNFTCWSCNNKCSMIMPNQQNINETLEKHLVYNFTCQKCQKITNLDPMTFKPSPQY